MASQSLFDSLSNNARRSIKEGKGKMRTKALLRLAVFLACIAVIAVPVYASETIDHTPDWNPFTIRSQDVEDSAGEVSVEIRDLAVSGDLYVGNTLTLSGTVDMTASAGIHGWWIHEAWASSWGEAKLTHEGNLLHYEPSPLKWADGYILSGWWWNIIPNDQSQTWDFSFDFTLTEAGTYTLKAFGHADAGYWRQHYDSEHPGWSWSESDNDDDSITFEVVEPISVEIDIKPGSDPNCFNSDGHGVIPVAILGSADFDASTVDPFSVSLDSAVVRVKGKSGNAGSLEDVNGDGFLDLVVQITDEGDYSSGDTAATLNGSTYDGVPIAGTDTICIRPPE